MKKSTLFSLLSLLLFFIGGSTRAEVYTHSFVTTDIPEGTTETSFTLSDVDWSLALDGGKVSVFSNDLGTHFGTNNATCNSVTLSTNGIPGTVASVTVEASRGAKLTGSLAVSVNGVAFETDGDVALTTTNAAYEFTGSASGTVAIAWTKSGGQGAFYIKKITIEYTDGGVIVTKPVITPAGGTFSEPQQVTITADEGCTIYYTLDGTDPTSAQGKYEAPFTVESDCTVKAVAYDGSGASSAIVEAQFKFTSGTAFTSIADLCAAATTESVPVLVDFNSWICTGVKGTNNAYFTDGSHGILLYEKSHGFEVGDKLTGTAQVNLTLYNECAEITGLTATTDGVVVTKGQAATPVSTTVANLQKDMQGCLILLEGVTYNATDNAFVDAAGGKVTPYDTFGTNYALQDGATYNATGVAIWFKPKSADGYWEIAPRTADEFAVTSVSTVEAPVITPAGGTYSEAQTVTITAAEGCTIVYTTDGTEPSATAGTRYSAPFTVSTDCTVKAIAYDADGNASRVASAEFKFITSSAIPTIARLCAAAPAEGEEEVLVEFNSWICTGVKNNNAYFTDGANGILLYQKSHGFVQGDKLTGSAVVTLTTYNECAEIKGLTKETEGVSVESGATATPMSVAIADLQKDMQGCLILLEGVTYDAEGQAFIDDDDNSIKPYSTFITLPELIGGKTYNATGVAIWYAKDAVWEIAPRTADEFQLITSLLTPVSSWSVESETVDVSDTPTARFTTNSDGAVTYSSSDESVATIDEAGNITPVGKGVTTITAYVAETATYLPDSKSFTLTVTVNGYEDGVFAYSDADITGQGAPDTGAELTATRGDVTLYANKAYAKPGDTHIKFYGSKYEGKDEDKVLTEPSYIRLTAAKGHAITKIVLTATGESYVKEWEDQFEGTVTVEGTTATWEGELDTVVLTNLATAQARIKTIAVTCIDTDIVDAVSTPAARLEEDGAIYNLAGQRMSKMQKGINIVGGRKIAVK